MKKPSTILVTGFLSIVFMAGCVKDNGTNLPYGIIQGRIMKASDSTGIASANITAYNANTNAPTTRTLSDEQGEYHLEVAGGTYYLKVAAQGFFPSPPSDGAPLPFNARINETATQDSYLISDPRAASSGTISGTITSGTSGMTGVLIVAVRTTDSLAITGVSGPAGFFVLYNMPAGTYAVRCYHAGYTQLSDTSVVVSPSTSLTDIIIPLSVVLPARLSGKITFLAATNSQVDITLVHPITRDAIPGLNTTNDAANDYSLLGIPPGAYIAWASYRNDGYVMDPDWIRKNGLPLIFFSATDTLKTLPFSVTGAISIVSPTNSADSVYAVPVSTTAPVFTWNAYASAKEYIIEVSDRHGTVIWGGFDTNGIIRHEQIDQHATSVVFNFDRSATDTLNVGEHYHWKIYADNDADADVQGLISASEDLRGLFWIELP